MADRPLTLYVIACGAPPAGSQDLPALIAHCQQAGWEVCAVGTRIGRRFLDIPALEQLTGHPVREDYKQPADPDVLPPADAMVCAPATFNTVNKLAAGISDTLPLGLLNEAIGAALPVIVAPWVNAPLAAHRAFGHSAALLREAGVRFVPDTDDIGQLAGAAVGNPFPWPDVRNEIEQVRWELTSAPR